MSLLIFITPNFAQQSYNPCQDTKYLELKKKKLDEVSDLEYEYFLTKYVECKKYNQAQVQAKYDATSREIKINNIPNSVFLLTSLILFIGLLYMYNQSERVAVQNSNN